jgi:predicted 3-demethylubiquinone-9 3-methyltransferase (glyoxalase superfamily)
MQKITPFLWFDSEAEEAAKFYTSVFKNSKIHATTRYDETSGRAAGRPPGSVMTVAFELEGQAFTALNGGPQFEFTEAISFVVGCKTQAEIDALWERLSEGGATSQCGWLKDRYGVSWQIVPANLGELLSGPDAQRSQRVMHALLKMTKLDLAALQRAYDGR